MEQKNYDDLFSRINHALNKVSLLILISAVVGVGGSYLWQQNKIPPASNSIQQLPIKETVKAKSIDDYLDTYKKFPINRTYSQVKQLIRVFALCNDKYTPPVTSEMCDRTTVLLSDVGWDDGKDHEFYFEFDEAGVEYFGPFTDNVLRLKQEASQKENFIK